MSNRSTQHPGTAEGTQRAAAGDRIAIAIDDFRRRLLDMTLANQMLSFKPSERSKRHIRIVDEIPSVLVQKLQKGSRLVFEPVPMPEQEPEDERTQTFRNALAAAKETDEAWIKGKAKIGPRGRKRETQDLERALRDRMRGSLGMAPWKQAKSAKDHAAELGIPTAYDLPSLPENGNKRHSDDRLQTLFFPEDLEAKLEGIHGATTSLEKDAGIQALYAAFGFLEWSESQSSTEFMQAPLLLWPIKIERTLSGQRYEYAISGHDEDEAVNQSLIEKLREEFGLVLPKLDDFENEEDGSVDLVGWLAAVEAAAKTVDPRWRVRNWVIVGLMTFHKVAIWRDLDPAHWPNHADPRKNELLGEVFGGGEPWDGNPAPDHDIDAAEAGPAAPLLITDADSSQHSAVIDALSGRSMVIQGPPGTGKSQTITNIIAAGLDAGKSVLFVSEKMAALEVVKNRLDAAGLGEFCLELHSDKASRTQVLESLASRLAMPQPQHDERALEAARRGLSECRAKLTAYAARMNAEAGSTAKSVHDVIWGHAATKSVIEQGPAGLRGARIAEALSHGTFERSTLARIAQALEDSTATFGQEAQPSLQPWRGVGRTDLNAFDAGEVAELAIGAADAIKAYQSVAAEAARLAGWSGGPDTLAEATALVSDAMATAPAMPHPETTGAIRMLADSAARAAANKVVEALERLYAARERLNEVGELDTLVRIGKDNLVALLKAVARLDVGKMDCAEIARDLERRKAVLQRVNAALAGLGKLSGFIPSTLLQSCDNVSALLRALAPDFPDHRDLVRPELARDGTVEHLTRSKELSGSVSEAFRAIGAGAKEELIPSLSELGSAAGALRDTGFIDRMFSGEYRKAKRLTTAIVPSLAKASRTQLADTLDAAATWRRDLLEFETHRAQQPVLATVVPSPKARFDDLIAIASWMEHVRRSIPLSLEGADLLRKAILETGDDAVELLGAFKTSHAEALAALVHGREGAIATAGKALQAEIADLEALGKALRDSSWRDGIPAGMIGQAATQVRLLVEARSEIASSPAGQRALGSLWADERSDIRFAREAVASAQAIASWKVPPVGIANVFAAANPASAIEALLSALARLSASAATARTEIEAFAQRVELSWKAWCGGSGLENASLSKFRRRADIAAGKPELLARQCALLVLEKEARDNGIAAILDAWIDGDLAFANLARAVDAVWHRSAAEALVRSDPTLSAHIGHAHETVRKRFQDLDRQCLALNRKALAAKLAKRFVEPGSKRGSRLEWTDRELIAHQCSLERPSMHLRRLFAQAGAAIRGLKPVIMMSPMSVARYLKAGDHMFDIVIIDEASQMRPEDAAGALLRGRQAIIVGDPKQLPPTSFFNAQGGAGSFDEDETEVDEESILELGMRAWKPVRTLNWHYRSRHDSLIAYSNSRFYDGRLVVFPAERDRGPNAGVHLVETGGVYAEGRNEIEARAVVEAAVAFMHEHPNESLGIVTMNQKQQELIHNLMHEAFRSDPVAQSYRQHWDGELESFFCKNLEAVQGDERHTIMISTGFGPDERGAFKQNFGPINQVNGHRRLNVLFTRAKHRMTIFTSMDPSRITPTAGGNEGPKVLKEYLDYARTGQLPVKLEETAGAQPDSEFERWFLQRLHAKGYEAVPQVGCAGYRLDIGIRHPDKPGRFILGVECDGATYHSSRVARDRDRLRQTILEQLGWTIHRVWSTDWFRDPEAEFRALERRLEQLRAA